MATDPIDYPYTLSFLKKLNSVVESHPALISHFQYEDVSLWATYQQSLFAEIKAFTSFHTKTHIRPQMTFFIFVKNSVLIALSFVYTFLSLCFLIVSRRSVLVYSIDRISGPNHTDFRLRELYDFFSRNRISYMELFHSVLNKDFVKKLALRKRLSVYLEFCDPFFLFGFFVGRRRVSKLLGAVDLSVFEDNEKKLALILLRKYCEAVALSKGRIRTLTFFLKLSGVKVFYGIDDARYWQDIILACRKSGVKSVFIQHGHYTKYHVGWLSLNKTIGNCASPDFLIVQNEFWKNELIRLGTYINESAMLIGTIPALSTQDVILNSEQKNVLLFPYETDAPKQAVGEYMKQCLECGDFIVAFKIREDIDKNVQLEEYGILHEPRILIIRNTASVLPRVVAVLGTYSSFLYEMIQNKCLVIYLETSLDYGEGLVHNNLAEKLTIDAPVCEKLFFTINRASPQLLEMRRGILVRGKNTLQEALLQVLS